MAMWPDARYLEVFGKRRRLSRTLDGRELDGMNEAGPRTGASAMEGRRSAKIAAISSG